ncbi:MAG: hypothetical protein PWQ15_1411 [Methanobacterium sp.]|jgi:3',5'-cyclic AMP phosphodiesterase CpdA|nr:hypothetical protein [Methanobacterium sp.]CDG65645.1 transcriptional regulator Icc-like protein [Methanobacterium sp. MB1]
MGMRERIIHISDLHFGEKDFSQQLKNKILNQIESENPDLVIVSGDLTTNGYPHEYEEAAAFIDQLRSLTKTYAIPGNHDARNVGLIHYENLIGNRKFVHKDKDGEYVIIGLDSSEPDINDGQIGLDQIEWLKNQLEKIPEHMGKIVTFHHHLMPIPQTGRERNILLDSGDVMRLLTDNGVDLVLNGHKHVPNVWMVERMVTLNAGTATTRKLRGQTRPCYNQLSFEDEDFVVNLVDTETGHKKQMAKYSVKVENDDYVVYSTYSPSRKYESSKKSNQPPIIQLNTE